MLLIRVLWRRSHSRPDYKSGFESRKKGGTSPPSSFRDDPEAAYARFQTARTLVKENKKYADKQIAVARLSCTNS
ncbi:hypothetical protein OCEANICA350_10031 [Oceanicaulis sp. 350]|nr:hypothetical protein OCEANICA350_10031 [Oceanicaulis sp. 350]